jgi:superfamily II DNA or RNA helicase
MPGNSRPKSQEELDEQVRKASDYAGVELVPPSIEGKTDGVEAGKIQETFSRRYELFLAALRKTTSVNFEQEAKMVRAFNNLDRYISSHTQNAEGRTLREHQFESLRKLQDFLEKGETEGFFKLPTGYGKTVLFTEFVEAMGLRTLVVVPRLKLVDQTEEKFDKFAEDIGVGLVTGKKKDFDKKVTIITYESFVRQVSSGKIKPEDYDCLILDEAHRSLTEGRMEAVSKFPNALKIGFTATPKFNADKQVSKLLKNEIGSIGLSEAIEDGMLCSVKCMLAKTNVDLRNVEVKNGDYVEADLLKAINIKSRNKAAVELYKKYFDGQLFMANCVNIEHAKDVAKEFEEGGVSVAYITSKTPLKGPGGQEEILENHRKGKIKVLCQVGLLTEGYDEPKVSGCFNMAPTRSLVVAEQRGGKSFEA